MSRIKFYKDIQLVRNCKVCRQEYRPRRFTYSAGLRLCWKCRKEYHKEFYKKYTIPFVQRQTPERQKELRKQNLEAWKKWVARHPNRRRAQALASYHRNKWKKKGAVLQ